MILRNFSLATVRVVGELDTFNLALEVRASGKDFRYNFEDCTLCDTDLEMGEVNTDLQLTDEALDTLQDYLMDVLAHEDLTIGLNGDIAVFSDNSEDGDSWAAIRFGYMTIMEV